MKPQGLATILRRVDIVLLGILPVPITAILTLVGGDLWIRTILAFLAFVFLPGAVAFYWLRTRVDLRSGVIETAVYPSVLGLGILAAITWTLARLDSLTITSILVGEEFLLGVILTVYFRFPKEKQISLPNLRENLSDLGFVVFAIGLSAAFLIPELVLQANGLLVGGDDALISRVGQVAFTTKTWPNLSQALHPLMSPADIAPGGPLIFGTFGAVVGTNPVYLSTGLAILSMSLATLAMSILVGLFNDTPVVRYGMPVVWLLGYAGSPFLFNLTVTFAINGGTPEGLMSIPFFILLIATLVDIIRSGSSSRTQLLLLATFFSGLMLLSQLTFLMMAILLLAFSAVVIKSKGFRFFLEGCAIMAVLSLFLLPPYLEISKAVGNSPVGNISSSVLNQLYYPYATDVVSITTAIGPLGIGLLALGFVVIILGLGCGLPIGREKWLLRGIFVSFGVTIIVYGVLSFTIIGGSLLGIGPVRFVEYIPLAMIPVISEGLRRVNVLTSTLRIHSLIPILLVGLIASTAYVGASFNAQQISNGLSQPSIFNYWELNGAQWLAARGSGGVVVADMNNGSSNAVFLLNFAEHPVVYRDKSELYLDIYGSAPPYNLPYYYANLVLNNPNSTNAKTAYLSMNFTYYFLEIPYNMKQIQAFSVLPFMELVFDNPEVMIFQYTGFSSNMTYFLPAISFGNATKGIESQYVGYGALNSSASFPDFPNAISSTSPSGPSFDGNSTSYALNVQNPGNYSVYIHRDENHLSEYLLVSVDGVTTGAVFYDSIGWGFGSQLTVFLPKGQHSLALTFEGTVAWASPVDYIVVAPVST